MMTTTCHQSRLRACHVTIFSTVSQLEQALNPPLTPNSHPLKMGQNSTILLDVSPSPSSHPCLQMDVQHPQAPPSTPTFQKGEITIAMRKTSRGRLYLSPLMWNMGQTVVGYYSCLLRLWGWRLCERGRRLVKIGQILLKGGLSSMNTSTLDKVKYSPRHTPWFEVTEWVVLSNVLPRRQPRFDVFTKESTIKIIHTWLCTVNCKEPICKAIWDKGYNKHAK